ncbi:GNAT family N-acetyltransferase [Sphingomonas sp. LaA6.9]|uniref:GNAT family N-acetyltransferase n=1 Tax=Sphingomonas sp. LaA6.9 TaxID=2919914 RepID=UPI001F4FCB8B|nr:GNAT family N-acetyltransferase [Sphingomonas sp. LaA6.9]MCJ8155799.1 GNAT family N-acetyltransferase [Sphingomonas sp. LaA6.9]
MTLAALLPLRFTIGARTLFTVRRRLVRVGCTLDDALAEAPPRLPVCEGEGYLVTSMPERHLDAVRAAFSGEIALVRQRYSRRFAALSGDFEAYFAGLSSNTRSALRRKAKKLAAAARIEVIGYRTPDEIAAFHALALPLSRKTYQDRLLGAGLPVDASDMLERAAGDRVRAWLLFADGRPIAYLHTPAEGDTLIYAHLGYDPEWADYSPGAVLQCEAMKAIFAEGRFARFDFTEGDGQHKRQFATDAVACVDLLLLRPGVGNRLLVAALTGFDRLVALAKRTIPSNFARRLKR